MQEAEEVMRRLSPGNMPTRHKYCDTAPLALLAVLTQHSLPCLALPGGVFLVPQFNSALGFVHFASQPMTVTKAQLETQLAEAQPNWPKPRTTGCRPGSKPAC